MRRVEANAEWSLFCPNEAPGLADCWGEQFDALYQRFERENRAKRVIKAQQLWFAILEAQVGAAALMSLKRLPIATVTAVKCSWGHQKVLVASGVDQDLTTDTVHTALYDTRILCMPSTQAFQKAIEEIFVLLLSTLCVKHQNSP